MGKLALAIGLWWIAAHAQTPVAAPASAPKPTVRPEDKCTIEGTVVDALTGQPLKKVQLSLQPIGQANGVPYDTASEDGGHFLLDNVDPGRYTLFASRNGYINNQTYSQQGSPQRNTPLVLTNGQHLKELVFKLTPQGVIAGHVVDPDGEPLAGVQVQTERYSYVQGRKRLVPAAGVSTNDLGEFRLFGLSPGRYVVSAALPPQPGFQAAGRIVGSPKAVQAAQEGYVRTFYPNTTNPESASQIEIAPGAIHQGLTITLARTHTVSVKGRVIAPFDDASAVRRANIFLIPRTTSVFNFIGRVPARVIDSKGNFELHGVAPGSYTLVADHFENNKRYSACAPVEVGDTDLEGLELTLTPTAELKGHVVIEENGHLPAQGPPLALNLQPKAGDFGQAVGTQIRTDDLSFTIQNVAPEQYDVFVPLLAEGFYVKSVRLGTEDVTESGLDFTQGVPSSELTVVLNPNGAQVEGTVQNAKGEPAPSAQVTLIPDEKHRLLYWLYRSANTDQNGHFAIKGIRPGDYRLYAWESIEPGAFQDPDYVKPHESAGQALSFREGAHESVQLQLIPADEMSGSN